MSAMCVFTPVIVEMSWPVISGLATAALTSAGYNLVDKTQARATGEYRVELDVKQGVEFAQSVGEGEEAVFQKDSITLIFRKGSDDRLKVCASAEGVKEDELKKAGQKAMNTFLQAYVRAKVVAALKTRGFKLEELPLSDGSIRLKARKWG